MPITCEIKMMINLAKKRPPKAPFCSLFGPLGRPLSGDGLEPGLDGLHGASEVMMNE